MAKVLKIGATNVRRIAAVATKKGEEVLTKADKDIYASAIRVLLNTLNSADKNAAQIRDNLNAYALQLLAIKTTMGAVSARLRNSAA